MNIKELKNTKINLKKWIIDLMIYITIIAFDAISFNIFLKLELGTYPFGIFVSNLGLLTPFSLGTIAFVISVFQILLASYLIKTRPKFEILIYSFLFAISVDMLTPYINELVIPKNLGVKLIILTIIIMVLDLSRTLVRTNPFPKLALFELLFAIRERFNINLEWGSRLNNLFYFSFGVLFSILNGDFLSGVGIGTIFILVLTGVVLERMSPKMHEMYFNLTEDKNREGIKSFKSKSKI